MHEQRTGPTKPSNLTRSTRLESLPWTGLDNHRHYHAFAKPSPPHTARGELRLTPSHTRATTTPPASLTSQHHRAPWPTFCISAPEPKHASACLESCLECRQHRRATKEERIQRIRLTTIKHIARPSTSLAGEPLTCPRGQDSRLHRH